MRRPAIPRPCPCGDQECELLAFDYRYCRGCGEHHRGLVTLELGERCPVDVTGELFDRADAEDIGMIPEEWYEEAQREARAHYFAAVDDRMDGRTDA